MLAQNCADLVEWGSWRAGRDAADELSRKLQELHGLQQALAGRGRQLELAVPVYCGAAQMALFQGGAR